ncbi:MAG: sodium:alanine symporter family protein [Oscillibacter sp.]|jgi:AGCS family alanine or glycine:cation symporter|nr:sodium:alanine symporter family protein [Oscillibacter sp.]
MSDGWMKFNSLLHGVVWGPPMLLLLIGGGVYLTVRLRFFQFTYFRRALQNTVGRCFHRRERGAAPGSITPFQAMTTALAATVGTGSIVGVTGAIALGGPGAVAWMELSALVGMATKFSEVTLAVRYRERNARGEWVGGPMYYIRRGLGKGWAWLGTVFALFGAAAAFGIGNLTQINSIASAASSAARVLFPAGGAADYTVCLGAGVVMGCACALTYLGGVRRIGAVTEKLVPVMALAYLAACLAVISLYAGRLPGVFREILAGAVSPRSAVGGVVGITLRDAMSRGVSRGIFSNEAGLGSAPIAHASADTPGPVQQGLYGIFEVFMDTVVICTLTALVILTSGVSIPYGTDPGVALANQAFGAVFGPGASVAVAVGIILFAGSTLLSWGLYGIRCAEYLLGPGAVVPYEILFCIVTVLGSVTELSVAWEIADTLNGLMAVPNMIAVLALSPVVARLCREYRAADPARRGPRWRAGSGRRPKINRKKRLILKKADAGQNGH